MGPTCNSIPRVSIASASGAWVQSRRGLPMSTVTRWSPARVAVAGPPAVSISTLSAPLACISSQPTQRRALPQVSTIEPSAFHTRMKASAVSDGSIAINWSNPSPEARSPSVRT